MEDNFIEVRQIKKTLRLINKELYKTNELQVLLLEFLNDISVVAIKIH